MSTVSANLGDKTTITIAPASLASSSTFVAGVESDEIDNSATKFVDALIEGFITVGTSPTINTQIIIYLWGSNESLATTSKDTLDGTSSAETLTSVGVGAGFLKYCKSLTVDATTSDRTYPFGIENAAACLGGVLPNFWGVFTTHNTGVNLNSTAGNHAMSFSGVKYDVV